MTITKTTFGLIFSEDWSSGTYAQWTKNVINSITDSIVAGEERITDATKSGNTYWIYDDTDTGSQHHATSVTSIPTNCVAQVVARATDDDAAEMGQGGIGFVKNTDKTIHACIVMQDGGGSTCILWAAGIADDMYLVTPNLSSGQICLLKIVKAGSAYRFYYDGNPLGDAVTDADAVNRFAIVAGAYGGYNYIAPVGLDNIALYTSNTVTVTGLVAGQKVEFYRASDDGLIGSASAAPGQTQAALEMLGEMFPESMYLKIYKPDGTSLIETTDPITVCGGDTWQWSPPIDALTVTSNVFLIYRSAATGTPKSAAITATLRKKNGDPYTGKTITFTASGGSVSPGSDTTDANGQAHTTLTATVHGLAVVKASWAGDATVPAATDYVTIFVFYEAEAGDANQDFQVFIQGIPYAFVGGNYASNQEGAAETFEVEIPDWISTITVNGLIGIYRRGTKEFTGVLRIPRRSLAPRVTLGGVDAVGLLDDPVVPYCYFDDYPQSIISYLLTRYPSGIVAGSLSSYGTKIQVIFDNISLRAAIQQVCNIVGWKFRVNTNLTLDFASSFGSTKAVTFTEGINIASTAEVTRDYGAIKNRVRMVSTGLVSVKADDTSIAANGVHELGVFQNKITSQASLDIACQALLNLKKDVEEQARLEVVDNYAVGTFVGEDTITATAPTLGLSGTYRVKRIERSLTDSYFAILDLSSRPKEWWALDQEYRRMTTEAST